jgi:hypothetical protein
MGDTQTYEMGGAPSSTNMRTLMMWGGKESLKIMKFLLGEEFL